MDVSAMNFSAGVAAQSADCFTAVKITKGAG